MRVCADVIDDVAEKCAGLIDDLKYFLFHKFYRMSFGWYRAEVIGALASVLMIWVITAILVYLAVQRCITQDFEVEAKMMLITSIIAILVNLM